MRPLHHSKGHDRDPSGVAVTVSHPGPDQVARSRIIARVYAL
ncbi:hypothetical protein [Streptacidiphilus sp. EB129]